MIFIKFYTDPTRCDDAQRHYRWLASLNSSVRLPGLIGVGHRSLTFERLNGDTARGDDLVAGALVLGQLSAAAGVALAGARFDVPHYTPAGWAIKDFWTPRARLLVPGPISERVATQLSGSAPSIYKDSNLRNLVVTTSGVTIVDFDDLTLAPHGYDLAKLVVSIAMTEGTLSMPCVRAALDAFNGHSDHPCTSHQLATWCELNWLLTAPYLGRHYGHPWPRLRPWPDPFDQRSSHGRHG